MNRRSSPNGRISHFKVEISPELLCGTARVWRSMQVVRVTRLRILRISTVVSSQRDQEAEENLRLRDTRRPDSCAATRNL